MMDTLDSEHYYNNQSPDVFTSPQGGSMDLVLAPEKDEFRSDTMDPSIFIIASHLMKLLLVSRPLGEGQWTWYWHLKGMNLV